RHASVGVAPATRPWLHVTQGFPTGMHDDRGGTIAYFLGTRGFLNPTIASFLGSTAYFFGNSGFSRPMIAYFLGTIA
ncbi:MAG TPA: hypothetical protein PLH85_05345, partial [Rhodocyclaceae bacterium]|nr:hypothetical protein [Rhodocyclaceae bacterium]